MLIRAPGYSLRVMYLVEKDSGYLGKVNYIRNRQLRHSRYDDPLLYASDHFPTGKKNILEHQTLGKVQCCRETG